MTSDLIYDVFLSHASRDKPQVEELARRLKRRRLKPFLDKWHLVPGEPWQEALEEALDQSRTFAIFLGPGELGPWQNEEMRDALDARVRDKSRRVIPVLLPGALMPGTKALPRFLRRLTWVDFRGGLDDPEAFHRLVCGIKGFRPEGRSVPTLAPARSTMIGVPHRNPFFTGREALLLRLHQQLQAKGIFALAQAAIHGLGGIGKTQTAIEYAHRFWEHYRFVLWVVAESEPAIQAGYLATARELGLVEAQADLETAVLAVKAWLSREDGWLLVFDNADDPALVRAYLPSTRTGGKVLLTSRAQSFAKVGIREPFRVGTPDPEEAVKFLIERAGIADTQAASELAAELGYLPLALEQAAAYIETVGGGFREYLARYRSQGIALFSKSKPSTDYARTVATTWTLSFAMLLAGSPVSAELLTTAAFLAPDSIPIEIFILGGSEFGGLLAQELKGVDVESLVFWELFEPLERYSLAERLPDDAFKLHRLTQKVIRDSLDKEAWQACAEGVIRALDAAFPASIGDWDWKLCERLQPNVRQSFDLTRTYSLEFYEAGRLFNAAGNYSLARGDYASAKLFSELALEILDRTLGGDHLSTLTQRSNLGDLLHATGDFEGARKLQEQVLEIDERVLGSEHPETLRAMNNLAATLGSIGDLDNSRKLHEQTMNIEERILGSEHLDTLQSRNNLAVALYSLGDLTGARRLHEQTLEIRERVLGNEHSDTTISTWNLLRTVQDLNDKTAEIYLIDKLRWLVDRNEDSIFSAVQRSIRQKLRNRL